VLSYIEYNISLLRNRAQPAALSQTYSGRVFVTPAGESVLPMICGLE